jgi:hypothetical protein
LDNVKFLDYNVDVAVDSNNDDLVDANDAQVEDQPPGLAASLNVSDQDGDGIPDFADGFNRDQVGGTADDVVASGNAFEPVEITLPPATDFSKARLKLAYSASAPLDTQLPTAEQPDYQPAPGNFRLWTKAATEVRNGNAFNAPNPGDYVPPTGDGFYGPAELAALGFSDTNRTMTFYLEAVNQSALPGDQAITIAMDPDGGGIVDFAFSDRAVLTAGDLLPDLEANGFDRPFGVLIRPQGEADQRVEVGENPTFEYQVFNRGLAILPPGSSWVEQLWLGTDANITALDEEDVAWHTLVSLETYSTGGARSIDLASLEQVVVPDWVNSEDLTWSLLIDWPQDTNAVDALATDGVEELNENLLGDNLANLYSFDLMSIDLSPLVIGGDIDFDSGNGRFNVTGNARSDLSRAKTRNISPSWQSMARSGSTEM